MNDKFCPKCFRKYEAADSVCLDCKVRLVAALDKDLSGSTLDDRYDVLERLGKGGMGVVYKARQRLIDRPVALKVLRRELVQDEASVKRFMVEAKAVSSLRSPHTVTLYDFGITQEGLLYFTMELLDGQPLTKVIRAEAPLSPPRAAGLIGQICDSLREAHGKGILHRDLKPDNIFLLRIDGQEFAKVLDFGIAKMLDDGTAESITKTGMICGTPMYLSPEQGMGRKTDHRSDLYSLGVIMYEMLAGQPPFNDATPVGILVKQVGEDPRPVSILNPDVKIPKALDDFLMAVLSKDPAKRPQNVDEFKAALEAALSGGAAAETDVLMSPLQTTSMGTRVVPEPEALPRPGMSKLVWAGVALVALAVLALGIAWTVGLFGGREPRREAPQAPAAQAAPAPEPVKSPESAVQPEPVKPPEPVVQPESAKPADAVVQPESAKPADAVVQPESAKPADAVAQSEPAKPPEPAVQQEPVMQQDAVVQPEPVKPPEPAVQPEPVKPPEPVVQPEPVKPPEPAPKSKVKKKDPDKGKKKDSSDEPDFDHI